MPYTHLTPTERGQLHALCKEGKFQTYMADCLGRHRSTISRELRRNRASHGYDAPRAQRQCDQRREWCRPAQKQTRRMLWRYVIGKLMEGGPPEAIAVRLPLEFPDDATMRISHEAIYRTLYLDKRWHHLIKYLPRARSKRRKRGQGKTSRGPGIPNRVGIEQRPAIVEERSRLATGKAVPSSARDSKAISLPSSLAPHVCSRAATWTRNMRTWSPKPSSTRSKRCPFPG